MPGQWILPLLSGGSTNSWLWPAQTFVQIQALVLQQAKPSLQGRAALLGSCPRTQPQAADGRGNHHCLQGKRSFYMGRKRRRESILLRVERGTEAEDQRMLV